MPEDNTEAYAAVNRASSVSSASSSASISVRFAAVSALMGNNKEKIGGLSKVFLCWVVTA